MEYYSILNLKKEPFSNSPEPEFFYEAPKHISCLQKLELAVRLRRGLNVVIGDVGTGKTTLCRKLIQQLSINPKDSQEIETYLLLDPAFDGILEFLKAISVLIGINDLNGQENEWQLKEKIKQYLFDKGVNENKIVVLIIDEGQKIPENCIEILREFLNYETNSFKLLQIIIFAQLEFKKILKKHANLLDRINYLHYLRNLNFKQMRDMICYRISVARNFEKSSNLFTFWAMLAIYLETRGYPRKVVSLCHQALLMLIIRGKNEADYFLLRNCIDDMYSPVLRRVRLALFSVALIVSVWLFVMQEPATSVNFYERLVSPSEVSPPKAKTISAALQTTPLRNTPSSSTNASSFPVPLSKTLPLSAPASAETLKMPDILGTITMKQGRTLWRTVNNIYGEVTPEIMEKLSATNPHIENINLITTGQTLNFPALPAKARPFREGYFAVVLGKGSDLSAIYDLFHENVYKKTLPPLFFLPYWNSKDGMTFMIMLDKNFHNRESAKQAIAALPPEIAAKAQVAAFGNEKSVFFNRQILKN